MEPPSDVGHPSLFHLFQNSLLLRHISPYIGLNGLVSLAATSKSFRSLLLETPQVFSRIDVTKNKFCALNVYKYKTYTFPFYPQPEDYEVGEVETSFAPEVRFGDGRFMELAYQKYQGPCVDLILGRLIRLDLLRDVRTLILDGLVVTNQFLFALLCGKTRHRIRLLSLREVGALSHNIFAKCLRHLVQRPQALDESTLKGLYLFTSVHKSPQKSEMMRQIAAAPRSTGVTNSVGAQLGSEPATPERLTKGDLNVASASSDTWYSTLGEIELAHPYQVWAYVLEACDGLIAFDATLCRHNHEIYEDTRPTIATVRLSGCQSCGSSPEGPAYPGMSNESHLPLVSPPPMHSFSVKAAQCLDTQGQPQPAFIARCRTCLKDRWCEQCNAWWCEACYDVPTKRNVPALPPVEVSHGVSVLPPTRDIKERQVDKHCYDCGQQCRNCLSTTQRMCTSCPYSYCIEHDDGCSPRHVRNASSKNQSKC